MFLRLLTLLIVGPALFVGGAEPTRKLKIEVSTRFNGAPLRFDTLTNEIANSQKISVTRLDFLLSEFSLRNADGSWLPITNSFAYINSREGRTSFTLNDIPVGQYERIQFHVGVPRELNHADPSAFASSHPLNPNLNGLHWNWQGGYVFLAIEGNWQTPLGQHGYSFHVATDAQLMTVELPVAFASERSVKMQMNFDVARIFSGKSSVRLAEENSSTHSRTNDPLALQLRENIESAFSMAEVPDRALLTLAEKSTARPRIEVALNATPFRFTFARSFPQPALPLDNPLTEQGVELGRRLFFDPTLSLNGSQSCSSCHDAKKAFSDDQAVSKGAEGKSGTRNAMPLFNLAWKSSFFWDGRAGSLREQVLQPIQNPIEMHETLTNVVAKLQSIGSRRRESALNDADGNLRRLTSAATDVEMDYAGLFSRAFGSTEITPDRIARALEQFLLTQVSFDSKFDRALEGKESLTDEEKRGFELFSTEYDPRRQQFGADCFHCHGGPLFQSQTFANNGLDSEFIDLGRIIATKREGDKGKFAVPSLRNVAVTPPYMHDGRFKTLEEVIEHYSDGVKASATLDPNIAKHPVDGLHLSSEDKQALAAFLRTLTDEKYIQSGVTVYSSVEALSRADPVK